MQCLMVLPRSYVVWPIYSCNNWNMSFKHSRVELLLKLLLLMLLGESYVFWLCLLSCFMQHSLWLSNWFLCCLPALLGTRRLLEENNQALNKISANLSTFKVWVSHSCLLNEWNLWNDWRKLGKTRCKLLVEGLQYFSWNGKCLAENLLRMIFINSHSPTGKTKIGSVSRTQYWQGKSWTGLAFSAAILWSAASFLIHLC